MYTFFNTKMNMMHCPIPSLKYIQDQIQCFTVCIYLKHFYFMNNEALCHDDILLLDWPNK